MRPSLFAGTLLVTLTLIDALLTTMNISRWGIECEFNPIMRTLIVAYGVWIMFAIKGFFGGVLLYMLYQTVEERLTTVIIPVMYVAIGIYAVIVFYGYILLTLETVPIP